MVKIQDMTTDTDRARIALAVANDIAHAYERGLSARDIVDKILADAEPLIRTRVIEHLAERAGSIDIHAAVDFDLDDWLRAQSEAQQEGGAS